MKKSRFSEAQIMALLRQAECRRLTCAGSMGLIASAPIGLPPSYLSQR